MNRSIDKYTIFIKTVELGSITKAAELLNYTQSGVSRAIHALEDECGFTLLVRGKKGVSLTANGEQILSAMREVVNTRQNLIETIDAINGLTAGVIRIGTFNSIAIQWLPRLISSFRSRFPLIEIKLRHGDYFQILHWIERGEVDCGFSTTPKPEHLRFIHLFDDELLVALPLGHPLCAEVAVSSEQLSKERFLLVDKIRDEYMVQALAALDCQPHIECMFNEDIAIPAMVEQGLGVSILSRMLLFNQPAHIELRPLSPPQYRTIGLLSRPYRYLSPATRRFIAQVKEDLPAITRINT